MSIKFTIKHTVPKAEKEGDQIVRFSGVSEPFNRHSERFCRKIGVDGKGNPKLVFNTGLNPQKVDLYPWYNKEEKEIVKKEIKQLLPLIENTFGKETLDPTNYYFWKEDKTVSVLTLKNENIDTFFDTDNAVHAILYLSIMSGAFIDLVAPTRDWAERHQIPHYMALETDNTFEDEDEITRSDAHVALGDLRKNHGKNSLFIIAWCIQSDTNSFGAYNYDSTEKDLITYHINYIEGKLIDKKKRNAPRIFMDYYNKWLGQKTRPYLYAEAYIKAGDYYNLLIKREKKYTTLDGTELGSNIPDAVQNIMKPSRTEEFEKLRDLVEKKWKE